MTSQEDKILKKYFGWTNKDLKKHEERHTVKTIDLQQPYWKDCEHREDGCLGCRNLRITRDISGYEARCTAKTEKGKVITWAYRLDMDEAAREVRYSLARRKAPSWCTCKSEGGNKK